MSSNSESNPGGCEGADYIDLHGPFDINSVLSTEFSKCTSILLPQWIGVLFYPYNFTAMSNCAVDSAQAQKMRSLVSMSVLQVVQQVKESGAAVGGEDSLHFHGSCKWKHWRQFTLSFLQKRMEPCHLQRQCRQKLVIFLRRHVPSQRR